MTPGPVVADRERLEQLLGGPDMAWLRDRVRARLSAGGRATGTATLSDPTPAQRERVDRLLGRTPSSGATLTVRLDLVDEILRRAGVSDGLAAAVAALDGPVIDRSAEIRERDAAWSALLEEAGSWIPDTSWADTWLTDLRASGLLRRLAGDPAEGRRLLREAADVLAHLPAGGIGRERLAATALSDSHGLDDDRPTATLVLKALRHRNGLARVAGPLMSEDRRALWASAGVLLSGLAGSALALNLAATGNGVTDRMLHAAAEVGEPVRLTLRQLVRHPPDLSPLAGRHVFVCENPAVVEAAAEELGPGCAPLVCVEGQPTSTVQSLLAALRRVGADLAYHGDFDWPGLRIAGLVIDRFGAQPWRFDTPAYQRAPAGPRLRGTSVGAPWDSGLTEAMRRRGVAVHEEQVLGELLEDLVCPGTH